MQPGTIRTKNKFGSTGALHGLLDVLESPNAGSIGKHIWETNKLINYLLLRAPSIGKTSQIR